MFGERCRERQCQLGVSPTKIQLALLALRMSREVAIMLQGGDQKVLTVLFRHAPPIGPQHVDRWGQSPAAELLSELSALRNAAAPFTSGE